MTRKAMSYEQLQNAVWRAWDAEHNSGPEMPGMESPHSWVVETYPDTVIVSIKDTYYEIPYTLDGEAVTFADTAEWKQVEQKKEWVAVVKALQGKALKMGNSLKAISKTDDELRVGNYIALFGGRDLEWIRSGKNPDGSLGEFFTEKTNFESSYTKAGVFHIDWEHGEGKRVDGKDAPGPNDVLGYVDWRTAKPDQKGVWVERVLSRRSEYMKILEELIDAGLVGTSSLAIPEGVKVGKNGEIKTWPLMRDTLTVSPAEPRMMTENQISALKNLAEIVPGLQVAQQGGATAEAHNTVGRTRLAQLKAQAYLITEE